MQKKIPQVKSIRDSGRVFVCAMNRRKSELIVCQHRNVYARHFHSLILLAIASQTLQRFSLNFAIFLASGRLPKIMKCFLQAKLQLKAEISCILNKKSN